ncbi:MAG: OmpA family protein [Gammaproteobacteria bacterium]|nr:OmpA family protein [Gammaproteobacteria bacterium]
MKKLLLTSLIIASIFTTGSISAAELDDPSTEQEIVSALSFKDGEAEVNGIKYVSRQGIVFKEINGIEYKVRGFDLKERGFDGIVDTDLLPKARASINFKLNSASILPNSYTLLNRYAAALKGQLSGAEVRVCGHTDSLGNPDYNKRLSGARAESVRQYLIRRGVQKNRLTIAAFGQDKPIADNSTEEGRARNRRVEFVRVDLR